MVAATGAGAFALASWRGVLRDDAGKPIATALADATFARQEPNLCFANSTWIATVSHVQVTNLPPFRSSLDCLPTTLAR
jgi:hypothetical protein